MPTALVVQVQSDVVALEKLFANERQVVCALATKEARELHAIVGRARLLTEHADFIGRRLGHEPLQQPLSDHAITDHDQLFRRHLAPMSDDPRRGTSNSFVEGGWDSELRQAARGGVESLAGRWCCAHHWSSQDACDVANAMPRSGGPKCRPFDASTPRHCSQVVRASPGARLKWCESGRASPWCKGWARAGQGGALVAQALQPAFHRCPKPGRKANPPCAC